jgi:hypothetical protein
MDLRSLRNMWNNVALPQIPTLPGESPSRTWPMLGMLALGFADARPPRSNHRRKATSEV